MATIEEHMSDCAGLIGGSFKDVHEWMDEKAAAYPVEKYGHKHREFRHNLNGIREAFEKFGSEGGVAAVIHFLRDVGGFAPTKHELQDAIENGISEVDWSKW